MSPDNATTAGLLLQRISRFTTACALHKTRTGATGSCDVANTLYRIPALGLDPSGRARELPTAIVYLWCDPQTTPERNHHRYMPSVRLCSKTIAYDMRAGTGAKGQPQKLNSGPIGNSDTSVRLTECMGPSGSTRTKKSMRPMSLTVDAMSSTTYAVRTR